MGVRALTSCNVPTKLDRITEIVAAVDDTVWILNPDGSSVQLPETELFNGDPVQAASARNHSYFVDGTSDMIEVDVAGGGSAHAVIFEATAGTAPDGPSLICFYRDRMILIVGQNFYASRSGDHHDFDYGQTDPAAAFAGNPPLGRNVGDQILYVRAFHDDILIFGCAHSIWRMVGDIAAGGTIQLVTDSIGIFGPNAATIDPQGNLWFVGEGDLYRMSPNGFPVNMTTLNVHNFMASIDKAVDTVTLEWNMTWGGCMVFITKPRPTGAENAPISTHLFFHPKFGPWPFRLPRVYDPVCAVRYDFGTGTNTTVLMGNRAGYIQHFSDDAVADGGVTDEGVPIESFIEIGPLSPGGGFREAKCNGLDFILGDIPAGFTDADNWNLDWQLKVGDDAKQAYNDPKESRSGNIATSGVQHPIGVRIGGSDFMLRLSNSQLGKFFALDQIRGRFLPGGRAR